MYRSEPSITVDYMEMSDSPRESFSERGFSAVRTLRCAGGDRLALMKSLVGDANTKPHLYPFANDINARVIRVGRLHPEGATTSTGETNTKHEAEYALLEVEYSEAWYGVDDNFIPRTEFRTIPNQGLFWDAAMEEPVSEDNSPGVQIKIIDWTFTIQHIGEIPSSWFDKAGKVNEQAVDPWRLDQISIPLGFGTECLLYNGPEIQGVAKIGQDRIWQVRQSFSYIMNGGAGWNRFWKPGTDASNRWSQIRYDDNGTAAIYFPYEATAFTSDLWGEEPD